MTSRLLNPDPHSLDELGGEPHAGKAQRLFADYEKVEVSTSVWTGNILYTRSGTWLTH